jgi:hypothetical protein
MAVKRSTKRKKKQPDKSIRRDPPPSVKRQLRAEVGFGCPVLVDDVPCANPFLTWHHFDPEWHVRHHHNPDGMLALCREHHDQAGIGAYTLDQVRAFKCGAVERAPEVEKRMHWMRDQLVLVSGGTIFPRMATLYQQNGHRIVWVNRDEKGYLLLNIRMPTISGQPRLWMEDNFWHSRGRPVDLVCPPSGHLIEVKYANGDFLHVRFRNIASVADACSRYPSTPADHWADLAFPLTTVEMQIKAGGTGLDFGEKQIRLPAGVVISGSSIDAGPVGIAIAHNGPLE